MRSPFYLHLILLASFYISALSASSCERQGNPELGLNPMGLAYSSYTSVPAVNIVYSPLFDSVCSKMTGYVVEEDWQEELNTKLPVLRAAWNDEGQKLLAATERLIEKPFESQDYTVTLSLCSFPSMSSPLLVNMRYSLSSFTKNELPTSVTISIIFHEILHLYLENKIPENSDLLEKYDLESQAIKDHLHLFALMKAVYLSLGEKQLLLEIIKKDDSLPNPAYKQTWEIINGREGYQPFLDELKSKNVVE